MTNEEIEGLVAAWVPRLGLSHWHVKVDWSEEAEEEAFATCFPHHQYDDVIIRFSPTLYVKEPAFVEWTVVHELLHLVTRDLDQSVESMLELLPRGARTLAKARHDHEIEGVVDRLAGVLVALAHPE